MSEYSSAADGREMDAWMFCRKPEPGSKQENQWQKCKGQNHRQRICPPAWRFRATIRWHPPSRQPDHEAVNECPEPKITKILQAERQSFAQCARNAKKEKYGKW